MAHLWIEDSPVRGDDGWRLQPLAAATSIGPTTRIVRATDGAIGAANDCWIALATSALRLNGERVVAGLAVLRDCDLLSVDGVRVFFSSERRATVVPFDGAEAVTCARCRSAIGDGSPAVRCPACDVWHHQSDLACWTYADRCALCDQPTALDAGFRWTPEGL